MKEPLDPPEIYTWNSWVIVHRGKCVQVDGVSVRNQDSLNDGHELKCAPLPCLVSSYPNEAGVEHNSANAWICLHRFVHIFLESHLAGPMSSEKRRVWIKYL